ncbi:MAG: tRNA preQ1(34) S-adenosylmethionine ribosyltransferase-isomerase QueA [Vampirovibrionales bacterium]|nr:tRNA preQ1(34) S-adenosylmethionine ribosyltransferase-isomerase QueA [Vampirovibrionales bacterium]
MSPLPPALETQLPDKLFRLATYDYSLPDHLIARYPLDKRSDSRMMRLGRVSGDITHQRFFSLPDLLQAGDLIVANNTRVLPARLLGHRQGHTGRVEVLLLYPDTDRSDPNCWLSMTRPTKKLKEGTIIELPGTSATVEVLTLGEGVRTKVKLNLQNTPHKTVADLMAAVGHMPIPPYLKREDEEKDKTTYQTVYAKIPGSQAAPTAGLHFTPEIIQTLNDKGIGFCELTLSVSSGTFKSVDTDDIRNHRMDPEHYEIGEETIEKINRTKANGGRVIAVGTTTLKTLETVAKKHGGQLKAEAAWSELFIYPGFDFQVVDGLITNFHLPKTTLLMLISAFAGFENIQEAYRQAVTNEYRFFSYGDCMLIV